MAEPSGDQTDKTMPPDFVYDPLAPDEPGSVTAPSSPATAATEPVTSASDDSTIGTGTSLALGCVVATVLLIVIAIIVLGVGAAFR